MNLDYFKTFINIVEKESLSEAAKLMGISQPAITMQLKAMEKEYGAILLARSPSGLSPTEAGQIFLKHAKRLVDEDERLRKNLAKLSGQAIGELKIGASSTPGEYLAPEILARFRDLHPAAQPKLLIADSKEIIAKLTEHKIDIALIGQKVPGNRFEQILFAQDELVLALPPNSPLLSQDKISIEDLFEVPLILREKGSATRKTFEDSLSMAGFDPHKLKLIMELGSLGAIMSAIEAGLGASVISRWAAKRAIELGLVKEVTISGLNLKRDLYLIYDKKRTLKHAGSEFIAFMKTEVERS